MTSYIFDSDGQMIVDGLTLQHDEFAEALAKYQDGMCKVPGCGEKINEGAIVCNSCFDSAKTYRDGYGHD